MVRVHEGLVPLKQKSWKIGRIRGRTAKQYSNYGELLYSEGVRKKELLKKQILKKQQDDELKEMKELTLRPEISKRAKQLQRDQGQIWHRLQAQDKPRQDQLQELRNEIWEAKLMECTFKPQINQRRHSEKVHDGRNDGRNDGKESSFSRFEQLFQDAENRRRRQAEYMQWYPEGVTFRPAINRPRHSEGVDDVVDDYHQEGTVFDRLLQYASKLVEKKQRYQQKTKRPIDPATGQALFRPRIGRRPSYTRNSTDLPIGHFLYKLRASIDSKKKDVAEMDWQKRKDQANGRFAGAMSLKLLERIRQRSIKDIFDYLDEDKDGLVELENADMNQLTDEVVEDVVNIKKITKCCTFEEFCMLMDTVQEKTKRLGRIHLVFKHKRRDDDPCAFQFEMGGYSRMLSVRRRDYRGNRQWYKLICLDRDSVEAKVEAMRKERESQEMMQCTFTPEINLRRGQLKLTCTNRSFRHKHRSAGTQTQSKIVEKEQQEMHGFIFQEDSNQGHEWLGKAASGVSRDSQGVLSLNSESHADDICPLSVIESMKQVVAPQSVESPVLEGPEHSYYERLYQRQLERDKVKRNNVSVNDLPDPGELKKSSLFYGLMGA